MNTSIEFKRVNNDINGNPRYVCHFLNLLSTEEQNTYHGINSISNMYSDAVFKAKKIGGKKYTGKDFGGGIVFQSYNIKETEKQILKLVNGQVMKTNKYTYLKVIQQNYGKGWEDVSEYETDSYGVPVEKVQSINSRGTQSLLIHDYKEYKLLGYPTRVVKRKQLN